MCVEAIRISNLLEAPTEDTPVTDGDGDDFTVHLSAGGDYEVHVLSDLHDGKFSNRIPAGSASATRSFELNGKISSARYVMVTTAGDNDTEFDAVERKGSPAK